MDFVRARGRMPVVSSRDTRGAHLPPSAAHWTPVERDRDEQLTMLQPADPPVDASHQTRHRSEETARMENFLVREAPTRVRDEERYGFEGYNYTDRPTAQQAGLTDTEMSAEAPLHTPLHELTDTTVRPPVHVASGDKAVPAPTQLPYRPEGAAARRTNTREVRRSETLTRDAGAVLPTEPAARPLLDISVKTEVRTAQEAQVTFPVVHALLAENPHLKRAEAHANAQRPTIPAVLHSAIAAAVPAAKRTEHHARAMPTLDTPASMAPQLLAGRFSEEREPRRMEIDEASRLAAAPRYDPDARIARDSDRVSRATEVVFAH